MDKNYKIKSIKLKNKKESYKLFNLMRLLLGKVRNLMKIYTGEKGLIRKKEKKCFEITLAEVKIMKIFTCMYGRKMSKIAFYHKLFFNRYWV